jgi:hypothetical protein
MSQLRRSIGILACAVALCAAAAVLKTRAADNPAQPTRASPSTPRQSTSPGAPQVPEESATIRDDPTIAPDPKQSADNNVSFPSDT